MDPTIIHFEIPAKDVEKLSAFYEKVFGWKIVKSPPMGEMEYWIIQTVPTDDKGHLLRSGVNGGMYRKTDPKNVPVNYVVVADIDKAMAAAKRLGAKVIQGKEEVPHIGFVSTLLDPEGNTIGMMQPLPM